MDQAREGWHKVKKRSSKAPDDKLIFSSIGKVRDGTSFKEAAAGPSTLSSQFQKGLDVNALTSDHLVDMGPFRGVPVDQAVILHDSDEDIESHPGIKVEGKSSSSETCSLCSNRKCHKHDASKLNFDDFPASYNYYNKVHCTRKNLKRFFKI